MGRRAAIAAIALLAGCHPVPPGPPPRCADAWRDLPPAARTYDFEKDAKIGARGNEGYERFADRVSRRSCAKAWTVLVYMAADADDLRAPATRDLRSIEDPKAAAGSTEQADVVVQLDRGDPGGAARMHLFRAPAAPAEAIRSPIVETARDDRVAPDEKLRRFLSWGIDRYPSEHYAVIVWGHGLGWRPSASMALPPGQQDCRRAGGGIPFDAHGAVLDTPGLLRALAGVSAERLGGRPIDVYASDACLMQSVEVAGELAGAARYVIGSEQKEEDYVGLPYATWLPMLNGSAALPVSPACAPSDAACHAAAALPGAQHAATEAPGYTLSTVDEAALTAELVPALRRLGAGIDAWVREDVSRSIAVRVLLGVGRDATHGTPGFCGGARDVGVFLERLKTEIARQPDAGATATYRDLLKAAGAARAALGKAVIAASFGARYHAAGFDGMAGVSVWLPYDADEARGRARFFAPSVLDRESPSFRGFLERVFAPVR
jgi:hypothetical protein